MASYLDRLIKEFGITHDAYSGGFILPDGSFLDLSQGSGQRVEDHRAILFVLSGHMADKFEYRSEALAYLCKRIKLYRMSCHPNVCYINTWTKPTRAQTSVIEQLADRIPIGIEAHKGEKRYFSEYAMYEANQAIYDLISFYN